MELSANSVQIVNAWLDCKWAMSIASITYALFMAANLYPSPALMLSAAVRLPTPDPSLPCSVVARHWSFRLLDRTR